MRLLFVLFMTALTAAADVQLDSLKKGAVVEGFRTDALYLNAAGKPIGGRFIHERSGFILDYLQIESVPQGYTWVNSIPVGDQGRAVEAGSRAQADARGSLVAEEPDEAGDREHRQVVQRSRMDEPLDGFGAGDRRRHEDHEHHEVAGPPFASPALREERQTERHCGERVPAVVHEVREQCDGS